MFLYTSARRRTWDSEPHTDLHWKQSLYFTDKKILMQVFKQILATEEIDHFLMLKYFSKSIEIFLRLKQSKSLFTNKAPPKYYSNKQKKTCHIKIGVFRWEYYLR